MPPPAGSLESSLENVQGPRARASGTRVPGLGSGGVEPGKPSDAEAGTPAEAVLCGHCGRTASNGLSCIGACVADSGY